MCAGTTGLYMAATPIVADDKAELHRVGEAQGGG